MRMFVAVDLDEASRDLVAETQRRALTRVRTKGALRLVDPQQVHLTLAFLGEVPSPLSDAVIDEMRLPFAGISPFQLGMGGLGMFPPRGAPRVLWLGLTRGVGELIALQSAVAGRLGGLGVTLEERDFHPHVTIARWRDGRPADRAAFDTVDKGAASRAALTVDRVTLFESRLSSKGASHFPLAHAPLTP